MWSYNATLCDIGNNGGEIVCEYCKPDETALDLLDSDSLNVLIDKKYIAIKYEDKGDKNRAYIKIDYCPMCGEKLSTN